MHGEPIAQEVIAEFRAQFLYSGNASKVARDMGMSERTGRLIASRLEEEPEFAEECRVLHSHALQRHIAMRLRVAEVAAERLEQDLPIPEVGEGATVTIIDKRADYGRLVLDAEKNALVLARINAEKDGEIQPREVSITVSAFAPQNASQG